MCKKSIVGIIMALGMALALMFPINGAVIARADENVDAADACFLEFVRSDESLVGEIEYDYTYLYDENLQINGRDYTFTVGNKSGYALLTEVTEGENSYYEVEEMFCGRTSPFADSEGLPVYITHRLYLDYVNGEFVDLSSNSAVSSETVAEAALQGFGYEGSYLFDHYSENVYYSDKSTIDYSIEFDLPNLFGSYDYTSCANTAGGVVIVYYDRFCTDLIPDYTPYISLGGVIIYRTSSFEVEAVVTSLYDYMGTDVGHVGTTFTGFDTGMRDYVQDHGYTYSSTSLMSGGSLNFNSYKAAVEANKPVAMFMSGFALLDGISEESGYDTIVSGYSDTGHVVVGCGYKVITYYDANGNTTATRTFLKVASGLPSYDIGYLNINGFGQMDRAIKIDIY